jgi:cytochrome P450
VHDLPSLKYVERVVTEAMRLYPPAWIIGRRALAAYQLGEFPVPARSILVMSPYIIQRDARYYDDAERFDPDRWTADFSARLPKFAYFPFGGGPRQCIGYSLAMTESILLLALIGRAFRFSLAPGRPVVPWPSITLYPRHGVQVRLHAHPAPSPV